MHVVNVENENLRLRAKRKIGDVPQHLGVVCPEQMGPIDRMALRHRKVRGQVIGRREVGLLRRGQPDLMAKLLYPRFAIVAMRLTSTCRAAMLELSVLSSYEV